MKLKSSIVLRNGKCARRVSRAEPRLLAMRDLFGDQQREEVAIGPRLALGALHEIAPDASRIGEVQPLEERIEVVSAAIMTGLRRGESDAAVLGRVQVLRCAPPLRAPSATWTRPARGSRVAAIVGGRSVAVERQAGIGGAEIVRDVLGADRLLGEAALEGRAQRRIAVRLQQRVQPLDVADPHARAAMRELGEIRQRRAGRDPANAGAADSAGRACRRPPPRAARDARAGSSRRRAANCRTCSALKRPATIRTRSR